MELTLAIHPISEIRAGGRTSLKGSRLDVNTDELKQLLLEDRRLEGVDIEFVRPGEAARLGYVFDVVEPRAKEPGAGSDFPGIIGPTERVGHGTTHVLRGAAVSVIAEGRDPPNILNTSLRGVRRVLEMSGEAGEASPYGALHHVVVLPHTRSDVEWHGAMNVLRVVSVKTAAYLARAAVTEAPASTEVFDLDGPSKEERTGLPRVAYIAQIHGHQHGTEVDEHILYGGNTIGMMPVVMHPNEWLDGALCISYSWNSGLETYFYQNHPVILDAYRRHQAGEINFVGTVAMVAASLEEERARNCMMAANMAKWNLAADGAVVTRYAGGAPHADMFETARLCEDLGVKTVVMVSDSASDRRAESAILMNIPEVNAIICSGSAQEIRWEVPAAERIIASNAVMAERIGAPQELSAGQIGGILNQQGASHLASIVY